MIEREKSNGAERLHEDLHLLQAFHQEVDYVILYVFKFGWCEG